MGDFKGRKLSLVHGQLRKGRNEKRYEEREVGACRCGVGFNLF
jgi:hypothetical protein